MEIQITLFLPANPTPENVQFMHSNVTYVMHPSQWISLFFSSSSTMMDAESAPPDLEQLFDSLNKLYEDWVAKSGKQLPPQWNMADLLWFVIGGEPAQKPNLLTDSYYDVVMHGEKCWLCIGLLDYLDLIKSQSFDRGILYER